MADAVRGVWSWLDDLGRDVRRALRGLRRAPAFTATVTLILALGIGANTAMFSIVYGILLRPLPYPDAGAIVSVGEVITQGGVPDLLLTNRTTPLVQEHAASLEQLAAYRGVSTDWSELGGVELRGARVSPSLFSLLRARPHRGRLFLEEEARTGAAGVVLLSHRVWTNRFAANPGIVGTTVEFDNGSHLVVGVLAEGFHFPDQDTEFWTPFVIPPYTPPNLGAAATGQPSFVSIQSFRTLGRLRPDVSAEQAAAEVRTVLQENADAFSAAMAAGGEQRDIRVVPLLEEMVGEYRPALSILTGLTVLMLLVACLNAAGLLLARGVARRRMLAISAALGASRSRLVRQLLTEGTVLSLSGGVIGLAAAALVLRVVPTLVLGDVARLDEVEIDGVVFAFAAGLSIAVGLVCGAGPAIQQSQARLARTLNEGGAQSGAGGLLRTHRMRAVLSAMQIAAAVALLIGAGLLLRSFVRLLTFDRGFDPDNVITIMVDNPMGVSMAEASAQMEQVQARHLLLKERLFEELTARLGPLPGVEAFGFSRNLPFGRNSRSRVPLRPAGTPIPSDPTEMPMTALQIVSPGYLDAMRFRLRAGRTFTRLDGRESPRVLVANETLARGLFGDHPAVGERVVVGFGEPWEVVGVVGDIVYGGLELTAPREAEAFVPDAQSGERYFGFSTVARVAIRTTGDPAAVIPFLREAVAVANPQATIGEVTTMEARLLNAIAWPRLYAFFVGSLAGLTLILAVIGVYGLLSYTVAQREREIGIRMALGARSAQITALVVGQGAVLVGAGTVAGVGVAAATSRMLESLLYGVGAADRLTFMLAPLVLAAAALVACWFPARRAVRIDPVKMLRLE